MLKTLLKKQILETTAFLFTARNGKRRAKGATIGFALLLVYAFVAIGANFWLIGKELCAPLVGMDMGWLYFAFMGVTAAAFGIIGSLFTAKAKLYEAKDNDLLLSMPIPAWKILFSRMIGLYLFAFIFESFVFIPTMIQYFVVVGFDAWVICSSVIVWLTMPIGAMVVACLLGWMIAWLSSKFPIKNWIEVGSALLFSVVYVMVNSKLNDYLGYVIMHGEAVGVKMKVFLYPFSQLGYACTGNLGGLGMYLLLFGGVFAAIYVLLSKTYIRLATTNRGNIRKKYKEKAYKATPVFWVLVKKEAFQYFKNPMVALNCFLGAIVLLALPAVSLFEKEMFTSFAQGSGVLIMAAILCVTATMNMSAASCISLEGERVALLRSMPVSTRKILQAKVAFHFGIVAIPVVLSTIELGVILKMGWICMLVLPVVLSVLLCSVLFGVLINLKMPNLHWTSEIVVVKQSFSTLIGMFFGVVMIGTFVGCYYLFGEAMPVWGFLGLCGGISVGVCVFFAWWLQRFGEKIWESL